MFDLTGKVALITGATGGIGKQIALKLHQQGAVLALTDISLERLNALKDEIGERVCIYSCDLCDSQSLDNLVKDVINDFGKIDILVNNAGITKDGLSMRMDDEQWQKVLDINLTAGFRLIRSALPYMIRQKQGRIINMASIVGVVGNPGQANYCASKAGLIAMSKAIAQEVAGRGITINCIAPGFIATPMTDVLPQTVKDSLLSRIPMKKLGTPEDIANGVLFLASKEAGYITGQTLHINGGMVMI